MKEPISSPQNPLVQPTPLTRLALGVSLALLGFQANGAGLTGNRIEEITVFGTQNALQGNPVTATEGVVMGRQLELRPVSRIGELLEFVPGLMATQHSGEGKANQYFLRGFNLDHGTDFAISVDGMPVNMPSHAHGQGYADLNFLIPEMTRAMLYRKGPYYAAVGDFSTAGSADFVYRDDLDSGVVSLTAGEHDYQRLFVGNSVDAGSGRLTAALAATRYAGPWTRDQNLQQTNGLLKYHAESAAARWSITGSYYDNGWDSSDQIPLRTVSSGQIGALGFIDPTVGGESHRHSLSARREQVLGDGNLSLSAYAIDYGLDLYSNFTYFLDDPVNGDQFNQADDRTITGFSAGYTQTLDWAVASDLSVGLQYRQDDADVGLYRTTARQRRATIRNDAVNQVSLGAHVSLQQQWTNWFRTVGAVRLDHYRFDIDSNTAVNSGKANDTLASPKLNLVFGPTGGTEYFLSYGRGFHSNDARGTTIRLDPASGDPVDAVPPLVKSRSYEAGLRSAALTNTQLSLSLFSLKLDSELVYVGDAGATEALGASKRRGLEFGAVHALTDWLLIDTDVTWTRARFVDAGADDRIPLAVERTASLGLSVDRANGFTAGLRMRYLGEAPLIEDNSVTSAATFQVNLEAGYALSPRWQLSLELHNLLDSDDNDITYFYESQLPGETDPVADIHFHPVEPRMLRLGITGRF
ncbi:MAG: hypothetical protein RLZZ385_2228 [Pseudomonadota bacterium]|jgi:hypothetical protein